MVLSLNVLTALGFLPDKSDKTYGATFDAEDVSGHSRLVFHMERLLFKVGM